MTQESHACVYWWVNDAMEAQTKAYEDELIAENFALRSEMYTKELAALVREKEVIKGRQKLDDFAAIFGRMARFIKLEIATPSSEKSVFHESFKASTQTAFISFLSQQGLSWDEFTKLS